VDCWRRNLASVFPLRPGRLVGVGKVAFSRYERGETHAPEPLVKLLRLFDRMHLSSSSAGWPKRPISALNPNAGGACGKRKTLLFKFKDDTLTTVSDESFSKVARILGFNDTQTLHFAIARLRDELLGARDSAAATSESPYPPLSAGQLLEIRSAAPRPKGKSIRKQSLF
jgi:hypothetical protein